MGISEKGQTDIVDIVRAIIIIVVLAWVGWIIAGPRIQQQIIQLASIIIGIVIVVAIIGLVVYLFLFTDVFASEEEKRRKTEELQKKIEEMKREQELKRSILSKKLIKEKGKELEGLTEEEKGYLLNKWIEEEEEKEIEGVRKPIEEKVPPLSMAEKERLIRIVGTRCCYPNCRETLALDVHHITPRSKGGTNKENNLIVLCPTHHRLARGGTIPRERLRQYSVAKVKKIG